MTHTHIRSAALPFLLALSAACSTKGDPTCPDDHDSCATTVSLASEPRGAHCPNGGVAILVGPDLDANGVVSSTEASQISYACNGDTGTAGNDGVSLQVSVSAATPEQCANGGFVLSVNGSEKLLCQGAPGADGKSPTVTVTAASAAQCANGGAVITVNGADTALCNGLPGAAGQDGHTPVVTATEASAADCPQGGIVITIDGNATAICNGTNGADGHTPTVSVSAATAEQCPAGGSVVTIDASEAVVCNGTNGTNGTSPVVNVSAATAEQCPNGGVVVGVVGAGPGTPVCNGAAGATGATGASGSNGASALVTKSTDATPTANCAGGTTTIAMGVDDGAGGAVANDGVLQAGEVRATFVVCN